MKKNIGEFSWLALITSIALCLGPAVCVYNLFSFQRAAPKTDVTPTLLNMQRQLDDLRHKFESQAAPARKTPTVENGKNSKKR